MSYKVSFTDHSVLEIDDDQGEKLKDLKQTGRSSDTVEVGESLYELGQIKSIRKSYDARPAIDTSRQIDMKRCRGQRSIQFYMMKVIRKTHPTDWPKYFRDAIYKEKLRLQIHKELGENWCDAATKTCVCDTDWEADEKRRSEIQSLFPGAEPLAEWDALYGEQRSKPA